MFKIKLTEKTSKNSKKLTIESLLNLSKADLQYVFNRKLKKINTLKKNNKYIIIATFIREIKNNNIHFLNLIKNDFKKKNI